MMLQTAGAGPNSCLAGIRSGLSRANRGRIGPANVAVGAGEPGFSGLDQSVAGGRRRPAGGICLTGIMSRLSSAFGAGRSAPSG